MNKRSLFIIIIQNKDECQRNDGMWMTDNYTELAFFYNTLLWSTDLKQVAHDE